MVVFGRNRLYVITRGILSNFCCESFSVIRSILLSRLILSRCSLIKMDVLRSWFSFPWDLNLLDLNLFAWFRWLDRQVNYLSIILGVQVLCEGRVVDQFLFFISFCIICHYVDIFQSLETQYGISELFSQILFMDVFYLNLWEIDQVHSLFLSRSRPYDQCIWNILMIFLLLMDICIFAQNGPGVYLHKTIH